MGTAYQVVLEQQGEPGEGEQHGEVLEQQGWERYRSSEERATRRGTAAAM
jgi:hypothetical protein